MSFRALSLGSLCSVLVWGCVATEPEAYDGPAEGSGGSTGGVGGGVGGAPPSGSGGALPGAGAGGDPATGGAPVTGGSAGAVTSGGVGGVGGATAGAGGTPVTAGTGGATGGVPSVGGSAGDVTAGAPTAGSTAAGTGGDTAGTGGAPAAGCGDGCAQLSVPFTAWGSSQYFEIYLSADTDLSGAIISVKARKVSGKAGGLLIVVKDGDANNYAYAQSAWQGINEITTDFTTYTLDVANPSSTDANNTFVPTAVKIISVQIAAGDPWYTDTEMTMIDAAALVNPTVVQIDEITVTGTGTLPGPYTFTADTTPLTANLAADALAAMPPYAVTGSAATWVAP